MAYESKTESKPKDDLLQRAKKCFKLASDVEAKQREREREDLRFQVAEFQWDDEARAERQGGLVGDQIIPARPILSISLLSQPIQLILNQAANAHLGVEIHPVNEEASQELAEIRQGLYRRIERDSNAHQARMWALARATMAGRGWYRIGTQYDEDSDETGDQEIVIDRILNQENVYVDPAAQKPDCSDARWGMVVCWVPVDAFEEQWPDAEVPSNDYTFSSWSDEDPQWVQESDGERAVLVAEYWYKEFNKDRVTGVKYCKLTAKEVLEEQDWIGMHIPLVPVWGRELVPFDGERRIEGVIRPARDAQKTANFTISAFVERLALEPKAPWVGTKEQFEGFEGWWQQANTRNFPYLLYNAVSDATGGSVPPPQRTPVDYTGTNMAMAAFNQARQLVQATTAVFAPSLGDVPQDQQGQSGRAILALQQQTDAGTAQFLQNLAKVSMAYEAKVVLDMLPKVYDRPGRITQILGTDDEAKMIMVNKPFVPGPQGVPRAAMGPQPGGPMPGPGMAPGMPPAGPQGPPMPGPGGMPGMPPPRPMPPKQPEPKFYDLSKGKYAISVSVGKSYQTRLQEGQAEIGDVLAKAPQLMPMIGDLYFKFRDFPGAAEIAERLKILRKQTIGPLEGEDEEGPSLPQAMAQIQQMQQQLQQMQQALGQAQLEIETDKAKQQATLQKTQMDNEVKMALAQLDAQLKMALAQMQQGVKSGEMDIKMSEGDEGRKHERAMQEDAQAHEVGIKAMEIGAQSDNAERDGERQERMSYQERDSESD